jgi:hypothetical protein
MDEIPIGAEIDLGFPYGKTTNLAESPSGQHFAGDFCMVRGAWWVWQDGPERRTGLLV